MLETIQTYLFFAILSVAIVLTIEVFFRNVLNKRLFNINVVYIMDLAKYSMFLLLASIFVYELFFR